MADAVKATAKLVANATHVPVLADDWFKNEVDRWYPLRHPNVLPLYGACHLTTPRLFVMAHAEKGNFREFLPKHRHLMWKLFLDVAHGLAYLHNRSPPLVHANLKCSNLLVLADGTGVVSDFAFAFARADSNLSEQVQAPSLRWKAPECLQLGPNANPRVQSDVYSLGLCVYEALTGRAPFENLSDRELLQAVRVRKELPARSDRISDEEWSLITAMCANDFRDRIKMDEVIRLMRVLAAQEKAQRAEQQCQCERGSCSDCGRGFARETSSSVVSTSKSDSSQLSSLLYSTMDAFRHLVGLVWGARSPQIEHGGCAPAPAG